MLMGSTRRLCCPHLTIQCLRRGFEIEKQHNDTAHTDILDECTTCQSLRGGIKPGKTADLEKTGSLSLCPVLAASCIHILKLREARGMRSFESGVLVKLNCHHTLETCTHSYKPPSPSD